jgi:YHS domain-containing protein
MEKRMTRVFALLLFAAPLCAAEPAKVDPREALKPFQGLVAPWKGTGVPVGTRDERQAGFWTEMVKWEWHFKSNDAALIATIEGGKHFTRLELRSIDKDRYRLTAETTAKETLTFDGEYKDGRLTVERVDDKAKETQRLVFRFLHANRITYQFETKSDGKTMFARKYEVGWTNQNEPFANNSSTDPECVVSGGKGTIQVSYKGKTYYVCCTGCRDEFKENPEKYIAEFEAKQKAKKK